MWDGLLAWMSESGQSGNLEQPRFADETVRLAVRGHVFSIIGAFTQAYGKVEFCHEAQRRRLPWAPVQSARDLIVNPQLEDRAFFIDVDLGRGVARDLGFAFAFPAGRRPKRLQVPVCDDVEAELLSTERKARLVTSPSVNATATAAVKARGALAETRVLDLTWVLAGPYATKILADHGAEVIKVESRHRPDPSRFTAALHLSRDPTRHPDTSGYFNNVNRNKISIVLNLGRTEGLHLLRRLVAQCDVVVENFSVRVMANWGLDFDALSAIRPGIILVSMAGMGHTGPYRDHVTYADAVQALAGMAAEVGLPGGEPLGLTFGLGDMIAGRTLSSRMRQSASEICEQRS